MARSRFPENLQVDCSTPFPSRSASDLFRLIRKCLRLRVVPWFGESEGPAFPGFCFGHVFPNSIAEISLGAGVKDAARLVERRLALVERVKGPVAASGSPCGLPLTRGCAWMMSSAKGRSSRLPGLPFSPFSVGAISTCRPRRHAGPTFWLLVRSRTASVYDPVCRCAASLAGARRTARNMWTGNAASGGLSHKKLRRARHRCRRGRDYFRGWIEGRSAEILYRPGCNNFTDLLLDVDRCRFAPFSGYLFSVSRSGRFRIFLRAMRYPEGSRNRSSSNKASERCLCLSGGQPQSQGSGLSISPITVIVIAGSGRREAASLWADKIRKKVPQRRPRCGTKNSAVGRF